MNTIHHLKEKIDPYRKRLIEHEVYKHLNSIEDLHIFMQTHVYCVWDFMSLLKSLQRQTTCVTIPWTPPENSLTAQLVNEIVLGEESDVDASGNARSHFELYLGAMTAAGADTSDICAFIERIKTQQAIENAYSSVQNPAIVRFLRFTFETIQSERLHLIAAVFAFGREDLIPEMFSGIVKDIGLTSHADLNKFHYYLQRHIELDGDTHGPMTMTMISEICGTDALKWKEATEISVRALKMRIHLWDSIYRQITAG